MCDACGLIPLVPKDAFFQVFRLWRIVDQVPWKRPGEAHAQLLQPCGTLAYRVGPDTAEVTLRAWRAAFADVDLLPSGCRRPAPRLASSASGKGSDADAARSS